MNENHNEMQYSAEQRSQKSAHSTFLWITSKFVNQDISDRIKFFNLFMNIGIVF